MRYYRTIEPVEATAQRGRIAAGVLLFPWRASKPPLGYGRIALSERPDGYGQFREVPLAQVESNPPPKWQEFAVLMDFYLCGSVAPPNCVVGKAETLEADLNSIAHGVGSLFSSGRLMLPGKPAGASFGQTCIANLRRTQAGDLTGEAHVLFYVPTWTSERHPRTARFRLCDHQPIAGASARPERGWNPARCAKCGLNMSEDSGD